VKELLATDRFELQEAERDAIDALVTDIRRAGLSPRSESALIQIGVASDELPARLRAFLAERRDAESNAVWTVAGMCVDDAAIGRTPLRWGLQDRPDSTEREELVLMLLASRLGEPFGWATQQQGALVHDLVPNRNDESSQVGGSSSVVLDWHTEEAFTPLKCDYLALMALRNHDAVATTVAEVVDIVIPDWARSVLSSPRFFIRPDESHLGGGDKLVDHDERELALLERARAEIMRTQVSPDPVRVLFGDDDDPYLCVDPYYMYTADGDETAHQALTALKQSVERALRDVALAPGEICFIDNFRAVHGRKSFRARYDGTDRWLKRVNISRNLRPSRHRRLASTARVIY
jgi:Fe(II)/alpha-ketoglutarate-dependent arginine beta-hydroxylase